MRKDRDVRNDFLKFVGLSLIILAHVSPPNIIFQLRIADVPIMIFASGMAYLISGVVIKDFFGYFEYVFRRFVRLVLPAWAFLTVYFLIKVNFDKNFVFDTKVVLGSFLLFGGIGYVWIIRVFLLIALVAPALIYFFQKFSKIYFYIYVLVLFAIAECWCFFWNVDRTILYKFVEAVFLYTLMYSICFQLGYKYQLGDFSIESYPLFLFFLIVFVVSWGVGCDGFVCDFQKYKYPPRALYISYSMLFCFFALFAYEKWTLGFPLVIKKFSWFVSGNTIWIYLWHIAMLDVWDNMYWLKRYFLVYVSAVIAVYLQVNAVRFLCKIEPLARFSKNIKIIFTG